MDRRKTYFMSSREWIKCDDTKARCVSLSVAAISTDEPFERLPQHALASQSKRFFHRSKQKQSKKWFFSSQHVLVSCVAARNAQSIPFGKCFAKLHKSDECAMQIAVWDRKNCFFSPFHGRFDCFSISEISVFADTAAARHAGIIKNVRTLFCKRPRACESWKLLMNAALNDAETEEIVNSSASHPSWSFSSNVNRSTWKSYALLDLFEEAKVNTHGDVCRLSSIEKQKEWTRVMSIKCGFVSEKWFCLLHGSELRCDDIKARSWCVRKSVTLYLR